MKRTRVNGILISKLTRSFVIRQYCLMCAGDEKGVKKCGSEKDKCPFHRFKYGKLKKIGLRKIRNMCLVCMNKHSSMIEKCTTKTCPIFIYRMGDECLLEKLKKSGLDRPKNKVKKPRFRRVLY